MGEDLGLRRRLHPAPAHDAGAGGRGEAGDWRRLSTSNSSQELDPADDEQLPAPAPALPAPGLHDTRLEPLRLPALPHLAGLPPPLAAPAVLGPEPHLPGAFLLRSTTVAQAAAHTAGDTHLAEQELPTLPHQRLAQSRLVDLL